MTYLIYLLSGLLIIHGMVCLLGTFIPLYPPVSLFYTFFPGHFAVRMIIVLLTGSLQVVYGGYLLLKKRRQVRWYWLALTVVVFAGLLLIFPAYHGLFTRVHEGGEVHPIPTTEPPYPSARPGPERPDDIMPTPGGLVYRANFHQEGVENPWPSIESKDVILAGNKYSPQIIYRDYIETKAGESRNNILYINTGGRDIYKLNLYTSNIPTGIEVKRGIRWQGLGTIAQVLVIKIAQDIQPAEYTFEIGVEINGTDCGTIPCTIEVLEATIAGIPSEPKEPYLGNHGITSTRVTPEPGDDTYMSSSLMIKLTTDDLIEKSDAVVTGKVVDIFPARRVDIGSGDWIITTDAVIEVERYLYGQSHSPYIAVMVQGGRVEQTFVWVEDQPEFNLGEEVVLFLNHPELEISPPEGFEDAEFYMVTGSMQGKFGYKDGYMVNLEGDYFTVSELEQKVVLMHGGN
jgi:hypothetical protein